MKLSKSPLDSEPLSDAIARRRQGFSGGGIFALVVAPDGSGLICCPVAGKTTGCERLSRDDMVQALTEVYGLAAFKGN
ncbi:hypothetical protein GOA63_26660 [Sinorhizobium meliloti]|uniref:hypothetical protein n=1 Tax=Rhizobium meliloti TaxID=382 RepID=UPI001296E482|nr:hypothetical protein [Sinorhizobium meliloti]MDW9595762.1 hypothetical protein [Sinorhizobium meliloti]MDX0189443.1 hypothetical protein [Sinorhizobium meliloti]MQV62815.1 hypothetical protein [Sinorhizobium meliloti]